MSPYLTGRFIREQRKRLGYSQQELSQLLYVEPQTISKWERGLGMPDYDNLEKLKDLFGCTLSDILEPRTEDADSTLPAAVADPEPERPNLPMVIEILNEKEPQQKGSGLSLRRILSLLNKNKIKETVSRLFGYEYEHVYTDKFLFRGLFCRRRREDYETAVTQGMFADRISHPVLGITAPWLYLRLFFVLLLCAGLGFICSAVSGNPIYAVLFLSMLSALPLTVFLFESNFARNVSILKLLRIFSVGGLLSILITLFTAPMVSNEILSAVVIAPIFEELAKAAVTVLFLARIKPKNLLTGLLVGFAVGAGFNVFEDLQYAINVYGECMVLGTEEYLTFGSTGYFEAATLASIACAISRAFSGFFTGHHYWTGLFGAMYVLFKRDVRFRWRELFSWRVGLTLLFCMVLHLIWNASCVITLPFLPLLMKVFNAVASIGVTVVLINVGIAQTKIVGIYESAKGDPSEGAAQGAEKYEAVL